MARQGQQMTRPSINTLVVEDEPLEREKLVNLLARDSEINVRAASVDEAVQLDHLAQLDLLLLDVRLQGASGFDFLAELQRRKIDPFVVLVTASREHAVAAFDMEVVDYVLKPFSAARFSKAIERAKRAIRLAADRAEPEPQRPIATGLRGHARGAGFSDRLLLPENGRVLFLPTHLIEFIQAAGRRVKVFAQGKCYTLREPLSELEARLATNQFVRIHKSTIVNVEYVVEMHALLHGNFELVTKRGTRLPLSRHFRERIFSVHGAAADLTY
jgi:two-component system, LytTR family, response regulator